MKILEIAPYFTNEFVPVSNRNITGFGYMVYDIAKKIAESGQEVDFLCLNSRYNSFKYDNINFVGISWKKILLNLPYCLSIFCYLRIILKYRLPFRTILKILYYWLLTGVLYKILKLKKYDIVHIHGCGFYDGLFIDILQHTKTPFLITLHGLNAFSDSVKLCSGGKKYEKDFLLKAVSKRWNLSVISSGMKDIIQKHSKQYEVSSLYVINNFYYMPQVCFAENEPNIRELYGIPRTAKVVLCVGNVSKRKNQELMYYSYLKLAKPLRENVYILFCGNILDDGNQLESLIENCRYKEHLILCGNIPKKIIGAYYNQADMVALLSISEGFGLSLIEGMRYGLPCLVSKYIDSFNDIYSPAAVVGVDIYHIDDVVRGFENVLTRDWNSQEIIEHSNKFSVNNIVSQYLYLFRQIKNENV